MKKIALALTGLILTACTGQSMTPSAPIQSLVNTKRLQQAIPQVQTERFQTIKNEVIVKYRSGFSTQSTHQAVAGAKVLDVFNTASTESTQLHRLPENTQLETALKQYEADPGVEFAIPNVNFQVQMTVWDKVKKAFTKTPDASPSATPVARGKAPSLASVQAEDPLSGEQWYLAQMQMEKIWSQYGQGNSGVTVAVLDTGVDYTHPDLVGRVIKGPDYIDKDYDPKDMHGHGTHVAGIIAAGLNNHEGGSGLAPDVKIMAIRVLDENGGGSLFNIAKGLAYAANHGAKVINLSLGSPSGGGVMKTLANYIAGYAEAKGSLIIAAAGNAGGEIGYPAAASRFMAVGAVNEEKYLASFSNWGKELDVVAPGVNILSTFPTYPVTTNALGLPQNYATLNGTSMATPMVSALAAIIWSQNPYLTPAEVRQKIESSATDLGAIGVDERYGHGLINPLQALAAAAQK